jgi:hypothetical protein
MQALLPPLPSLPPPSQHPSQHPSQRPSWYPHLRRSLLSSPPATSMSSTSPSTPPFYPAPTMITTSSSSSPPVTSNIRNTIKIISITSLVINCIVVLLLGWAVYSSATDKCDCHKTPLMILIGILLVGSLFHIGVGSFVINKTK